MKDEQRTKVGSFKRGLVLISFIKSTFEKSWTLVTDSIDRLKVFQGTLFLNPYRREPDTTSVPYGCSEKDDDEDENIRDDEGFS